MNWLISRMKYTVIHATNRCVAICVALCIISTLAFFLYSHNCCMSATQGASSELLDYINSYRIEHGVVISHDDKSDETEIMFDDGNMFACFTYEVSVDTEVICIFDNNDTDDIEDDIIKSVKVIEEVKYYVWI